MSTRGKVATNVADELIAESFVHHAGPGWEMTLVGKEYGKAARSFSMLRAAFPDLEVSISEQVGEGDLVVTRKTFRGTHQAEFMGVPASGKRAALDVIDIIRIVDGKIAEHWNVTDIDSPMRQVRPEG